MAGFGLRRFIKAVIYSKVNHERKCAPIITCIVSFQKKYLAENLQTINYTISTSLATIDIVLASEVVRVTDGPTLERAAASMDGAILFTLPMTSFLLSS